MYNPDIVVLRVRKGVPGIGRKLANHFNANEVTCGFRPKFKVPDGAVVMNYGRSDYPVWFEDARERGVTMLNNPNAVKNSVDKVNALTIFKANGVPCLEFSTNAKEVHGKLSTKYRIEWVARETATGKQGKGIVPIYGGQEYGPEGEAFPMAPLYTKFYDKTHEFRVHVFRGKVIDYVQKKRMGKQKLSSLGINEPDMLIRNHKRGWVFAHNDIIRDKFIEQIAVQAANCLGLDYAGIDILAKIDENGKVLDAVVCESNSAPGMSSKTTFTAYTKAIQKFINERKV